MRPSFSSTLLAALLLLQLVCLPACAQRQDSAADTHAQGSGTEATSGTGELHDLTADATEEYVRLVGRTCQTDGITWLPQSGSAVEFSATGTRVTIKLTSDADASADEDHQPRFAVLVDGEVVLDSTVGASPRTVEAFSSDAPRSAVVEVLHLSEASSGAIGIAGITITSDAPTPLAPTEPKDLNIEFVGDSITCAYGVEAKEFDEPFKTTTENFMKSYAYLTAQALDADYSTVCYSGYGIISGWSATGDINEGSLLPPLYDLVAKDRPESWDFAAHEADIVVINLGTNDFTYTKTDEERMQTFAQAYAAFLAHVRSCNPKAYLICTLGVMDCQELYPSIEQAAADFQAATGDTRITSYLSPAISPLADGFGAQGHPTLASQQRCADALVEIIRELGLAPTTSDE